VNPIATAGLPAESSAELPPLSDELVTASQPFMGRWNRLVSTTNWEKGRIIGQWRESLISQGLPQFEYSDEAWSQLVGGVSGQHVGRLRRVYQRFGHVQEQFPGSAVDLAGATGLFPGEQDNFVPQSITLAAPAPAFAQQLHAGLETDQFAIAAAHFEHLAQAVFASSDDADDGSLRRESLRDRRADT